MPACGLTTLKTEEDRRDLSSRLRVRAVAGDRRLPQASWLILSLGFGGLLICIVAAAVGTLSCCDGCANTETQSRKAFLERLSALDQIRAQIYLSGTYVRDFLLSPDPAAAHRRRPRTWPRWKRETTPPWMPTRATLEPEEREPFLACATRLKPTGGCSTPPWRGRPRNGTACATRSFTTNWSRAARPCCRSRTASPRCNERGLTLGGAVAASADGLRRSSVLTFAGHPGRRPGAGAADIGFTLRLERELERAWRTRPADLQELSALLLRAQENERRALARELHDEIGQSLSAILMETEGAECAEQPAEIREHLASIRTLAEKTVNQVRDLALLLRPSMLDDLGLAPALNWHARETTQAHRTQRGGLRRRRRSTACRTNTRPASTGWCRRR